MDTWKFAHVICGRIWIVSGCISFPIAVISMLWVMGKTENNVGYMGAACLLLPMILMIVSIIATEVALKKKFDKYGQPKNG